MKVLAVNGSPKKNGTTDAALKIVMQELSSEGIEVSYLHIGQETLKGCTGCLGCRKNDNLCIFNDEVTQALKEARTADGFLFGTPTYYGGIGGTMKNFLDRFFFSTPDVAFKVGASVTVLRRSGGVETFHEMQNYFQLSRIITVPSHYWNAVHGDAPEELKQDEEGIQLLQALGKNMAWLMQVIRNGKAVMPPPTAPPRVMTNFVRQS